MKRTLSQGRWIDRSDITARLAPRAVARPWGRAVLPHLFADFARPGETIGEIWHEFRDAPASQLLIKHLFTADFLSIQVHPDAPHAEARGLPFGKDEAWLVIGAEPGAVIGLGLKHSVEGDELREAALEGSIEDLIDWRPVAVGDVLACPGGTIHAIGRGVTLIEVQQNLDLTYRLYDYGRPRALHLDDAIEVALGGPAPTPPKPCDVDRGRQLLLAGNSFILERWRPTLPKRIDGDGGELLLIPITCGGRLNGVKMRAGEVWHVPVPSTLEPYEDVDLLVAYPGSQLKLDLWG